MSALIAKSRLSSSKCGLAGPVPSGTFYPDASTAQPASPSSRPALNSRAQILANLGRSRPSSRPSTATSSRLITSSTSRPSNVAPSRSASSAHPSAPARPSTTPARKVASSSTPSAHPTAKPRSEPKRLSVWVHKPVKTAEDLLKLARPFHVVSLPPAAPSSDTSYGSSPMSADSGLHDPPLPRVPVHAYRPNDVPVSLTTPGPPLPSASTTPCASSGIGTEAALPARPSARVGKVTPVSQRTASSDSPGPSGRFSASTSALSLSGQDINSVTALRARCEALSDEIAVLKQDQALVNQDAAARCGSLEQQVDVLIKERVASDGVRTQLVKEVIALKTRVQELTQLLDKSASDAESMAVDDARDDPISSNSSPSSILNAPSDHNRGDISFSELPSRAHGTVHPDYAVACEIHAFTTSHHAGYDQVSDGAGSGQGTPTSVDVGLFYAPVFVTEVESIPAPASSTTSSQQTLASDATGACPPRWQPQPIGSPRWLAPRTSPARYGRSRQLARRLSGPDEFERNRLVMLELLRRYAPGAMEAPFLAFVNECCVDHYSDLADIGDRMVRQHRRVAELTDLVYQLEAKLLVEKERSVAIADRLLFSNQALRRARRNQDPRPGERPEPADHEARIDYAEGECTRLESELELQKDITRICFSRLYRLSLIVMERGLDQLEQGFVVPLLPEGAGLRPNVVQATAGRLIGAPGVQARSARAYTEFVTGGRSDNDTRLDNDRAKQSLSFEACAWDIDDTDGIYERLDECPSPPAHIGSLCHADAIDDYYSDLMKRSAERRLNEPLFDPSTFGALGLDLGTVRASP